MSRPNRYEIRGTVRFRLLTDSPDDWRDQLDDAEVEWKTADADSEELIDCDVEVDGEP